MGLALIGLLALVGVAGAGDDDEVTFTERCRDGQKESGMVPCDIDDRADGTCTFGERGGKSIEVRVGKSSSVPNSCGVVGTFVCESASR
jgi:hypothetical protein